MYLNANLRAYALGQIDINVPHAIAGGAKAQKSKGAAGKSPPRHKLNY